MEKQPLREQSSSDAEHVLDTLRNAQTKLNGNIRYQEGVSVDHIMLSILSERSRHPLDTVQAAKFKDGTIASVRLAHDDTTAMQHDIIFHGHKRDSQRPDITSWTLITTDASQLKRGSYDRRDYTDRSLDDPTVVQLAETIGALIMRLSNSDILKMAYSNDEVHRAIDQRKLNAKPIDLLNSINILPNSNYL